MALPVSPETLWTLFVEIKDFINKVQALPSEVDTITKRILGLETVIFEVKKLSKEENGTKIKNMAKDRKDSLGVTLAALDDRLRQVKEILHRWNNNIGPGGFQWTSLGVALGVPKAYFQITGGLDKLKNLTDEMDLFRKVLHEWLMISLHKKVDRSLPPKPAGSAKVKQSVSILFIDKDNVGRSKVAEGYAALVREWTVRTGGHWPVSTVHSKGLNIQHNNQCLAQLRAMKEAITPGNESPKAAAMSALFDNHLFNESYKPGIKAKTVASKSNGPSNGLFKDYDYVIVFTELMETNLQTLRTALVKQFGQSAAPNNKGKVKLLGKYKDQGAPDIFDPQTSAPGGDTRQNWDATTRAIKVSFKNFLKFELDWVQPEPRMPQNKKP